MALTIAIIMALHTVQVERTPSFSSKLGLRFPGKKTASDAESQCSSTAATEKDSLFQHSNHSSTSLRSSDAPARRVHFNPKVRVRPCISRHDMSGVVKLTYWGTRPGPEELREMIDDILEESPETLPDLLAVPYKLSKQLANELDRYTLKGVYQNPESFARFVYNDDETRGFESYLSNSHRAQRRQQIYRARSLVMDSQKAWALPNEIAHRYGQVTKESRILARLRGCADELSLQQPKQDAPVAA